MTQSTRRIAGVIVVPILDKEKRREYQERRKVQVLSLCPICGVKFLQKYTCGASGPKRKYCSRECSGRFDYREKYKRTCVECGKEFISKAPATKTCGGECRSLWLSKQLTKRHASRPDEEKKRIKEERKKRKIELDRFRGKRECELLTDKWMQKSIYIRIHRNNAGFKYSDVTQSMIDSEREKLKKKRSALLKKEYPSCSVFFLKCVECGLDFTSRHQKICCSVKCDAKYRCKIKSRKYSGGEAELRTCLECGRSFKPDYGDKRRTFCGKICRVLNSRYKRRYGFNLGAIVHEYPELGEMYRALRSARRAIHNVNCGRR